LSVGKEKVVMAEEFWKPVETAPEFPDHEYLAVDCCGHIHRTSHDQATLMLAGWAVAWAPAYNPNQIVGQSIRDGGRELAAVHAREFKRLVLAWGMGDEVIEGVALIKPSAQRPV
jgi:hypothetical protein